MSPPSPPGDPATQVAGWRWQKERAGTDMTGTQKSRAPLTVVALLAITLIAACSVEAGAAGDASFDTSYDAVEQARVGRDLSPVDTSYDQLERARAQRGVAPADASYDAVERLRASGRGR